MTIKCFDLFVIGGGSGGVSCARRAASQGARVAVAEGKRWGGTCVNVGCVPKKIMWWCSSVKEFVDEAHHYGFQVPKPVNFSWEYIKQRRDASVKRLNGIYASNLENSGVTKFGHYASFTGKRTENGDHILKVGDEEVQAARVLIAVGGRPSPLGVPGEEYTINSDGFFDLEKQPKKVAVLGAGYIAVELAGIFKGLGSETHLFCRGQTVLRKFDQMIQDSVSGSFGDSLHPNSKLKAVHKDKQTGLLSLELESETLSGFDCVLAAIGRVPETEKLNLKAFGADFKYKGPHIQVDEYQNTSIKNVYAVGDVCGVVELTPMAIAAGRRLADRLFLRGHDKAKADYENVPTVIFSHPPCGTIGMSESEAKDKYGDKEVLVYNNVSVNLYYNAFDMPPAEKPRTRVKMICLKSAKEKVVGLHIWGMAADEMLQGFGLAMKLGATKADFDSVIAIHPSAAEEVVTCAPWGLSHPDNDLETVTSVFSDATQDDSPAQAD